MDATVRTPIATGALLLGLCLAFSACLIPTHAQLLTPNNTSLPEEPVLALDIDALITDSRVFETSVNGNIWEVKAMPGRRLIQIPILVTPKDEDTRLSSPTLKLRGGRFIAWHIVPDAVESSTSGGYGYDSDERESYRNPTSIGSLRSDAARGLDGFDQPTTNASGSVEPGQQISQEIPVLARDMTITPRGVILWELERAIPGAEVKSGDTGYLLKLRPDRLAELEPARPERTTRSTGGARPSPQDAREAEARRRAEDLEYREKARVYRELRQQVQDLPEKFQAPLPSRLWAIFEVPDRLNELSFTGDPPMPWTIAEADITALKELATRSGQAGELTTSDFTTISQMTLMLADEHPLTQRTIASSLGNAGMLGQAQQGDALYRLIDRLLKSKDAQTVRIVTAGLAKELPPSPATLALLKGAFDQMDPASKLLALGGLLTTQGNDPIGQRQMIDTANQMIADPQGPGVVYVLNELALALAENPEAIQLVGAGIRFDALDAEALDQAIIYTADAAGDSPLAAEWMEHGLLGSPNAQIVRRTVELLGTSAPGGGMVSMISKQVVIATFGQANPDAARRDKPPLRGIARIPINSTGHSIYRVLNAGDPELRTLGWKALRHFQISNDGNPQNSGYGTPEAGAEPDRLTLILNAAFGETVTPPQLVMFLVNQEDAEPATAALVRIVVEGRGPAITQAARALVRSGRRLEVPLQSLTPEQRGSFASRLYESVTGSSPMVAGLMRDNDPRSPIVGWFAKEVSTTGLPESAEWVAATRGEEELLNLAASSDPELADAAVGCLVASVGGDETTARDLARRMSNATDRSPTALRQQWSTAKQDLYTAKLTSAAGNYRLIVNLRGSGGNQPNYGMYGGPGGYGMPRDGESGEYDEYGEQTTDPNAEIHSAANLPLLKSINLALIELRADGQSLELASGTLTLAASDERLAIVLKDPKELKDFGNSDVAELPIENIQSPIELLPQKGRVWRGAASLGDGRSIEVLFDPE